MIIGVFVRKRFRFSGTLFFVRAIIEIFSGKKLSRLEEPEKLSVYHEVSFFCDWIRKFGEKVFFG